MVIWRIIDGKRGHDNQSLGMVNAIFRHISGVSHNIPASALRYGLLQLAIKKYPPGTGLPEPDLIIGAGHRTHISLLCARRAYGGRSVVIMKPGLPASFFDFCLIPEHDRPANADNIMLTHGAINSITPSTQHDQHLGLILIGGPSRHYGWDNTNILEQIDHILSGSPEVIWQITDSPRTPPVTSNTLAGLARTNANFHSYRQTDAGWVSQHLMKTGYVWVSADSMSMIYEALTSGAATGILSVPPKNGNKITRNIETLDRNGMITRYEDWHKGKQLTVQQNTFNEADRCAKELLSRIA